MAKSMEAFIADLRVSLAGWKEDVPRFEAQGATDLVRRVREWINEAEDVIALHENRHR